MPLPAAKPEASTDDLTATQQEAVQYSDGSLLVIAGAGTGKTTVITRRIAWMLLSEKIKADQVLALTFTDKAASEMEERVDLLMPYGYVNVALRTFHAFGDQLLREHATQLGLSSTFRVLSKAEQQVFLNQHIFDLPLSEFRPLHDPTRFVEALATLFSRAKDEAVTPEAFLSLASQQEAAASDLPSQAAARRTKELALAYAAYEKLLRANDLTDFGDQVFLAVQLLERHPEVRRQIHENLRAILVDEFQDTNFAQFRLLELLTGSQTRVTVVADDDQSIYKWRGAAISNVVKFLEQNPGVKTIVLKDNFRSTQAILDCAYRLIQFNNPDRLEVRQGVDKRLISTHPDLGLAPQLKVFDTVSAESDWVAGQIRSMIDSGKYRASEIAVLVRSNREADLILRALNVAGVPWRFSGSSGLFAREESKMLLSCLKALGDPEDSLSWYHVASSALYAVPMPDLTALLAAARTNNESFKSVAELSLKGTEGAVAISESARRCLTALFDDVSRLLELSRKQSPGQLLYQWLAGRDFLKYLGMSEAPEELIRLQTVARFFDQLRRIESLIEPSLATLMGHLEVFQAMGNEPVIDDDAWSDRVQVLTLHKAKGLEFSAVFMVGLVHGRFPTPKRRETIELPEALIRDLLPSGDYHLQEERRLFYVGMTRAKRELFLTCAYNYGGKSIRKVSQFVAEALDLATSTPAAPASAAKEKIARFAPQGALPVQWLPAAAHKPLRLDAHGVDDYLTCPLKYRYSHIIRIPIMRHPVVSYGSALHKAVEHFFIQRLKGIEITQEQLLGSFHQAWRSEGFLTKEHESLRLQQGEACLRRFFEGQQSAPEIPSLIEEKFAFTVGDCLVTGRWDRVDRAGDSAVIIDYKSSDVRDQKSADKRTRESLQLLVYSLAWQSIHGNLPSRVELRFLETGVIGHAVFDEADMDRAREYLQEVSQGIRSQAFKPTPTEFECRWCAYQAICPAAF